jgi:hypothetical protein
MTEHSLSSWVFELQQTTLINGREIHFRRGAGLLRKRGMQPVCVIPVTANHLRLGTVVVPRENVDGYPDVTSALSMPMTTLLRPR